MERVSATPSVLALSEAESRVDSRSERQPRRLLHFSDGVIEEYSTEEEEEEEVYTQQQQPRVNPESLPWLQWMWYYMHSAASSTYTAADVCGEKLAWLFGITSPKYQYALDEFNRQQNEDREERDREGREREVIKERRGNRGDVVTIATVSHHTVTPPLASSDRTLVNQSHVPMQPSVNQSAASIHSPHVIKSQSGALIHSARVKSQSSASLQDSMNRSGTNDKMSVFPD